MWFSTVLLLVTAETAASGKPSGIPVTTFRRVDPGTGRQLTCDRCPAGTHMASPCTATRPTWCAPCGENHYTEGWNFLPRCLFCSTFCGPDQDTQRECSATGDRQCVCRQGFHNVHDFCIRHAECPVGHGVRTRGTALSNTECERCPQGSFSDTSSSRQPCAKHRSCSSPVSHGNGTVLLRGSASRDAVCGPCVATGGRAGLIRSILTGLFVDSRMSLMKMRSLVWRYMLKRHPEPPGCFHVRRHRKRALLLDRIMAWLGRVSMGEMLTVPKMLRECELSSLAKKTEAILVVIQGAADCDGLTATD